MTPERASGVVNASGAGATSGTVFMRDEARAVALDLGERIRDVRLAELAFDEAERQLQPLRNYPWRRLGLAEGHAGLAVFFAALDVIDPSGRWDRAAHAHMERAAERFDKSLGLGMFGGLAGLGLAGFLLSREGSRYQ